MLVRKGVRASDTDNGMLLTTVVNVTLLSSGVSVYYATGGATPEWNTIGFAWFVIAGVLTSLFGRGTLFAGIRHIGSSRAAAIKNTAPVVTVAVAVFFIGESLSGTASLGIAAVFSGLLLLVYDTFRRHQDSRMRKPRTDEEADRSALETVGSTGKDAARRERSSSSVASSLVIGTLFSVLAAVFFGSGQAVRKIAIEYMPEAALGAMIASWAALLSYLTMSAMRGRFRSEFKSSFGTLRPYFWLAGIASTVGQVSFFIAITFAQVSYVSVIAASETLLTLMLSAVLVRHSEKLTFRVSIAAVCVFFGAAIIALS